MHNIKRNRSQTHFTVFQCKKNPDWNILPSPREAAALIYQCNKEIFDSFNKQTDMFLKISFMLVIWLNKRARYCTQKCCVCDKTHIQNETSYLFCVYPPIGESLSHFIFYQTIYGWIDVIRNATISSAIFKHDGKTSWFKKKYSSSWKHNNCISIQYKRWRNTLQQLLK